MDIFIVMDQKPCMKVISSIWAFKVKQYPDGWICKLKAWLCARRYLKRFLTVVQCLTVCYILIMTIILGLKNKQIDYTTAFVQALIDTSVYVKMPKLFSKTGKV